MIHSITAKNFHSIEDEVGLSFVVDENAPNNEAYIKAASGTRLSLVEVVIGPNASGKSNLLKVLPAIQSFIVESYRKNSPHLPVEPFAANKKEDLPSILSATFEIDSKVYTYSIALTRQRLMDESLSVRDRTQKRTTTKQLFSKSWNSKSKSYTINSRGFGLPANYDEAMSLSNASIIGAAQRFGHDLSKKIFTYWSKLEFNVNLEGFYIYSYEVYKALMDYQKDKEGRNVLEDTLRRYNMGFDRINKDELVHKFGDRSFSLPLDAASSGTQQLITLSRKIDKSLRTGGTAVIDEFDAYLHPAMVQDLVQRFLSRQTNPKHSQLLMSTHNHQILNMLDKYQVVLVEKNNMGATNSWRLDEIKGIRPDENIYAKYIAGAYKAIPKID